MNIKIPRKIVVVGNRDYGLRFLGEAQSQLAILENQMKFQNLSQGVRNIKLNDNIHIECWSCFSAQGIKIITVGVPEEIPIPELEKKCWCGGCFTYAKIIQKNPSQIPETNILIRIQYDVEFCTKDNDYILLQNSIYSSSHEEFFIDDIVILGLLPNNEINCCENTKECIFDSSIIGFDKYDLVILPFEIGNMEEWIYQ